MGLEKKIVAVVSLVILFWWLSPIPEVSILLGLLGWKIVPLSWPLQAFGAGVGACVGLLVGHHWEVGDSLRKKLEEDAEPAKNP